ncbi:MAG: toxin-antitoxin system HicB family antitoxin [Gemmatimonadota bacterium]|nr:toxin-antitoxin system HicB family antitoxin [Gemmatimonadota bacterium]
MHHTPDGAGACGGRRLPGPGRGAGAAVQRADAGARHPELHRAVAVAAARQHKSMNAFVTDALEKAVGG